LKRKRITVFWEDHHERDGQGDPVDPEKLKPMIWESTGYLISENDAMLEIARDISSDQDVYGVGASLRIMKKCILKRSDQKQIKGETNPKGGSTE